MRYSLQILTSSIVLLCLAACGRQQSATPETTAQLPTEQQRVIDEFYTRFTDKWVEANPNLAVATGFFTGPKQAIFERQLTPLTLDHRLQLGDLAQEGLDELTSLSMDAATDTQRLAAKLMQWQLQLVVDEEPFLNWTSFPLEQMNGAAVALPNQLTVVQPLFNAEDAENYIERLKLIDDRMREATEEARRLAELNIMPPDNILQTTIEQMQRFVDAPATENPLVTTFLEKTELLTDLAQDRRTALAADATQLVETEVYPAWQEAISVLRAQQPRATSDAGLWRFENGADVYAFQLRRYTTTNLTADEIHDIGLAEVARIEAEMNELFAQIGLTNGSINERVQILQERLAYPDTDAGRDTLMARIQTLLADAHLRSAALFDRVPTTAVIAQPYPRFRWENAAASYTAPPLDGSRPGIFQMPLRPSQLTEFSLRSLIYHETVPGHHFQIALMTEDASLPKFMQTRAFGGISAITEGWALYAERLAAESGWYEGDIEGRIGQLESALFRARRLVVDTGLHAKRWTRQQAIDYGIEPSEVDRYIVFPGQACSYMIGQLKLVELRERARAALGAKFDIRQFHNVVLGAGAVPLLIIEEQVDEYIQRMLTEQ